MLLIVGAGLALASQVSISLSLKAAGLPVLLAAGALLTAVLVIVAPTVKSLLMRLVVPEAWRCRSAWRRTVSPAPARRPSR